VWLNQEIAKQELDEKKPAEDLLTLPGMTTELARQLVENEVLTRDDLAEKSVLDLKEIIEIDDEAAANLIMAARAHWFAEEESEKS
ncbi:helix-hairpin-helix domain-containing protein, partial [Coxiella burnetii]